MLESLIDTLRDAAARAGLRAMPRQAWMALALLCVLALAWGWWRWQPAPPGPELLPANEQSAVTTTAAPPGGERVAARLLVHVTGQVREPGVYELDDGAQVVDAIDAAGGLLGSADQSSVNLARKVSDGEQIVVGDTDQAPSAGGDGSPGSGSSTVDINTADATALDTLPGIGPSTADKIVSEREANGPFGSVDDLGRVAGIGPKKIEALRDYVRVP